MAHCEDIAGRVLVVTTSNGTKCVHAALSGAADLLVGSTVNASATANVAYTLAQRHLTGITLVAAGLGGQPALEDTFAQRLLAMRLIALGALPVRSVDPIQESESLETFLRSKAAGVLTRLDYADDVELCAQIDLWDTVAVHERDGFRTVEATVRDASQISLAER
jgi:2-phosphosulfolactate phosphatase